MKILLTCFFVFGLLMGGNAHAAALPNPRAVVFLPGEVMVTVEERVPAVRSAQGQLGYRILLPDTVKKNSFVVSLNGQELPFSWIDKKTWELVKNTDPAAETDPARKELLTALVSADNAAQALRSSIAGLEQTGQFWKISSASQGTREKVPTAEELLSIANAMEKEVAAIETAIFEKRTALITAEQVRNKAKDALNRYDMARPLMVEAAVEAPAQGEAALVYSYVMPASTRSVYMINAAPEEKKLSLAHSVELVQYSGADWKDVDVSVAFVSRSAGLQPDAIRPWLIDYLQEDPKTLAMSKVAMPVSGDVVAQYSRSAVNYEAQNQLDSTRMVGADWGQEAATPESAEMSTFRLWSLGKRSIGHDTRVRFELGRDIHDATYLYTLRPDYGRRGTLTARLEFDKALELPAGQANCFVDDVYVGSQQLNVNGKKAVVYLGTDPQVTVDRREMSMQKGEQGVFNKAQTRVWHWAYTVTNNRSKPVDVVVETAQPVSLDTGISITVRSKPDPKKVLPDNELADKALKLFVWEKALKAGEAFTIDHKVSVDAAVDRRLNVQQ